MTKTIPDDEIAKAIVRIIKTRSKIIEKHGRKRNLTGVIKCEFCSGEIAYSIAGNGHIHAKCETKDCVSWVE